LSRTRCNAPGNAKQSSGPLKRAYERLGISSQSELFAIVLRLPAGSHGMNLVATTCSE